VLPPPAQSFTARRVLRGFFFIHVFFKVVVWWGVMNLLGLVGAERITAIRAYIGPAIASTAFLFLELYLLLRPIDRWARSGGDDEALRAACLATRHAPRNFAICSVINWVMAITPSVLILELVGVKLPDGSLAAGVCVQLAMMFGAASLGYLEMLHALGPMLARLSLDVRQRGLVLPSAPGSLRRRNQMFALALVVGPALFLTGTSITSSIHDKRAGALRVAEAGVTYLAENHKLSERLLSPPGARIAFIRDESGMIVAQAGDGSAAPGRGEVVATRSVPGGELAVITGYDDGVPAAVVERFLLVFAAAVLYGLLSAKYLSTNMLTTVERVAHALREITRAGKVTGRGRIPMLQRDELGILVESANTMIDRLEEAQSASSAAAASLHEANARLEQRVEERTARLQQARSQLADAARRAGMAETAAALLHNVGNVLNSVNVSTSMIADTLRGSKATSFEKALALLPEGEAAAAAFLAADPRGKKVPEYLRRVGHAIVDEHATMSRELGFLSKNVEHIKTIVALQLAHAKGGGLTERLHLGELIDDAVRFSLGTDGAIVQREVEDVELIVDRHQLFQIVVNLLRNARDAVKGVAEPRIVVRATHDDGAVRIEVQDNGCGVAPENLPRIFNLGFTTKVDGHGYGLHSSALAATDLGGGLEVRSDGPGLGTTFVLRLPPPRVARPAA
jgi:signal transduction histidine kinase